MSSSTIGKAELLAWAKSVTGISPCAKYDDLKDGLIFVALIEDVFPNYVQHGTVRAQRIGKRNAQLNWDIITAACGQIGLPKHVCDRKGITAGHQRPCYNMLVMLYFLSKFASSADFSVDFSSPIDDELAAFLQSPKSLECIQQAKRHSAASASQGAHGGVAGSAIASFRNNVGGLSGGLGNATSTVIDDLNLSLTHAPNAHLGNNNITNTTNNTITMSPSDRHEAPPRHHGARSSSTPKEGGGRSQANGNANSGGLVHSRGHSYGGAIDDSFTLGGANNGPSSSSFSASAVPFNYNAALSTAVSSWGAASNSAVGEVLIARLKRDLQHALAAKAMAEKAAANARQMGRQALESNRVLAEAELERIQNVMHAQLLVHKEELSYQYAKAMDEAKAEVQRGVDEATIEREHLQFDLISQFSGNAHETTISNELRLDHMYAELLELRQQRQLFLSKIRLQEQQIEKFKEVEAGLRNTIREQRAGADKMHSTLVSVTEKLSMAKAIPGNEQVFISLSPSEQFPILSRIKQLENDLEASVIAKAALEGDVESMRYQLEAERRGQSVEQSELTIQNARLAKDNERLLRVNRYLTEASRRREEDAMTNNNGGGGHSQTLVPDEDLHANRLDALVAIPSSTIGNATIDALCGEALAFVEASAKGLELAGQVGSAVAAAAANGALSTSMGKVGDQTASMEGNANISSSINLGNSQAVLLASRHNFTGTAEGLRRSFWALSSAATILQSRVHLAGSTLRSLYAKYTKAQKDLLVQRHAAATELRDLEVMLQRSREEAVAAANAHAQSLQLQLDLCNEDLVQLRTTSEGALKQLHSSGQTMLLDCERMVKEPKRIADELGRAVSDLKGREVQWQGLTEALRVTLRFSMNNNGHIQAADEERINDLATRIAKGQQGAGLGGDGGSVSTASSTDYLSAHIKDTMNHLSQRWEGCIREMLHMYKQASANTDRAVMQGTELVAARSDLSRATEMLKSLDKKCEALREELVQAKESEADALVRLQTIEELHNNFVKEATLHNQQTISVLTSRSSPMPPPSLASSHTHQQQSSSFDVSGVGMGGYNVLNNRNGEQQYRANNANNGNTNPTAQFVTSATTSQPSSQQNVIAAGGRGRADTTLGRPPQSGQQLTAGGENAGGDNPSAQASPQRVQNKPSRAQTMTSFEGGGSGLHQRRAFFAGTTVDPVSAPANNTSTANNGSANTDQNTSYPLKSSMKGGGNNAASASSQPQIGNDQPDASNGGGASGRDGTSAPASTSYLNRSAALPTAASAAGVNTSVNVSNVGTTASQNKVRSSGMVLSAEEMERRKNEILAKYGVK